VSALLQGHGSGWKQFGVIFRTCGARDPSWPCDRVGRRLPFSRGRPVCRGGRGGAGSYRAASSRRRVRPQLGLGKWQMRYNKVITAKLLSVTTTRGRSGSQRRTTRNICRAQSVSFLCR
jgi:hypothetical protein